jgi:uncharacterized OB-fold protein
MDDGLALGLLPVTDDIDTAGFWDAARQHRLVIRTCRQCQATIHMPMAHCAQCGSWDGYWRDVSGRGRLHSWTVVEHQVHPSYPVPYTIVLVDLDDAPGARLVGRLDGAPELHPGQSMEVHFEPIGEDVVLPNWQPAASPETSSAT